MPINLKVNNKAVDSTVNQGFTAPRGTPLACALVFETKRDPNGMIPLQLTLSSV